VRLRQSSGRVPPPSGAPSKLGFAVVEARRPKLLELGVFLVVVAVPLAFTPFSSAPFADAKLVLLILGALLMALAGVAVDRRLAALAAAWVAATAVATILGVDPAAGLVASTIGNGGGLVFTACCAVAFVVGAGLPPELRDRARGWFAWTGTAIAALLLINRVAPSLLDRLSPDLSFVGSTMGNPLFAGACVAAAMAAAAADTERSRGRRWLQLVVMTFGLAAAAERSSLILPLIAIPVVGWRAKLGLRQTGLLLAVIVVAFAAWQAADDVLPGRSPGETATQQLVSPATDTGRFIVWRASLRAWEDRPIVGWGPNTTQAAYLHAATPEEVRTASRRWNDAHDLFLETGVSSGILGLVTLIALLGVTVVRALQSPPNVGWAVAAAATLGAYSLVEPLNLAITPLLFLFAGISAGAAGRAAVPRGATPARRLATGTVVVCLAAGFVLAVMVATASVFEEQGTRYGDEPALRTALSIQPWRITAVRELGQQLAVDGRAGNAAAAAEARALMRSWADDHPWNPSIRVYASNVDTLLHEDASARAWLVAQLQRFPGDAGPVSELVNAPRQPPPV
jgi:O-antigen ligase